MVANAKADAVQGSQRLVRFRRGRATSACEVCHARKVRCNMVEEFPCSNCRAFEIECTPRAGRGKRRVASDSPETKRLRESSPPLVTQPAPPAPSRAPSLAPVQSTPSGTPSDTASGTPNDTPNDTQTSSANDDMETRRLARNPNTAASVSQTLPGSAYNRLFDQGNSAHVLRTLSSDVGNPEIEDALVMRVLLNRPDENIPKAPDSRQKGFKYALLLPTPELSDHLVEVYFQYIHPYIPVVHKADFMEQYRQNRDKPSLLVRQAMFSAAARLSLHPQLLDANGTNTQAALEFYHRAKILFDINYENSMQTLVLASVILAQTVDDPMYISHNAFFWIRMGITIAQGMALYRRKHGIGAQSELQRRRRVLWWCLYKRDIVCSMAFGRPAMINLEDCDIDMIVESDFESSEGPLTPGSAASMLAHSFVQSVKLHEILGLILRMQFTAGAERLRRLNVLLDATQCDRALAEWVTHLPQEIDNAGSSLEGQYMRRLLYLEYYTIVCLSHRPQAAHLFQSGSAKDYPIWGIAFQAAHMVLQLMESFDKEQLVCKLPSFAVYSCFSAVLLLSFQLRATNDADVRMQVADALRRFRQIGVELSRSHFTGAWVVFFTEELQNPRLATKIVRGMYAPPATTAANTNASAESPKTAAEIALGTSAGLAESEYAPQMNFNTFPDSRLPPPPEDDTSASTASAATSTTSAEANSAPSVPSVSAPSVSAPSVSAPSVPSVSAPSVPATTSVPVPTSSLTVSASTVPAPSPLSGPNYIQQLFPQSDFIPENYQMQLGTDGDLSAPDTMNMADWYTFLTNEEDDLPQVSLL